MTEVMSTDPTIQLAALMIDADDARSRVADETIAAAHREQMQAFDEQIRYLHEAADDVRAGAWAQGLTTIAGAGLTAAAHIQTTPGEVTTRAVQLELDAGKGLSELAPKLGDLVGTAPSADDNADAKRAEQHAADAGARADEAKEQRRRAFESSDRTLSTLQSTLESNSQGHLAIIANV
jgi:hypothetical protein